MLVLPSYRKQSIDLYSKTIECFLYEGGQHWDLMGLKKPWVNNLLVLQCSKIVGKRGLQEVFKSQSTIIKQFFSQFTEGHIQYSMELGL